MRNLSSMAIGAGVVPRQGSMPERGPPAVKYWPYKAIGSRAASSSLMADGLWRPAGTRVRRTMHQTSEVVHKRPRAGRLKTCVRA